MRRSIFIIIILLIAITAGLLCENKMLNTVYEECTSHLEAIYNDDDKKNADEKCKEYLNVWNKHKKAFALLITHTDTDEIIRHNTLLTICAQNGDFDRIKEEIGELYCIYNNLKNKFKVNLENIL